ncbi:MAG: hypothetical protein AAB356_08465, partial [Deltaproteobacteria bacterium]
MKRFDIPVSARVLQKDVVIENYYATSGTGPSNQYTFTAVKAPASVVCVPEILEVPVTITTTSTFENSYNDEENNVVFQSLPITVTQNVLATTPFSSTVVQPAPPMPITVKVENNGNVVAGLTPDNLGKEVNIITPGRFDTLYVKRASDSGVQGLESLSLEQLSSFEKISVSATTSTGGTRTHDFICTQKTVTDTVTDDFYVRECAAGSSEGNQLSDQSQTTGITNIISGNALVTSDSGKLFDNPSLLFLKSGTIAGPPSTKVPSLPTKCSADSCPAEVKDGVVVPFLQNEGMFSFRVEPLKYSEETDLGVTASQSWKVHSSDIVLLSYKKDSSLFKVYVKDSKLVCELNDGNKPSSSVVTSTDVVDVEKPFVVSVKWGGVVEQRRECADRPTCVNSPTPLLG